jgi:hypothetical protein
MTGAGESMISSPAVHEAGRTTEGRFMKKGGLT